MAFDRQAFENAFAKNLRRLGNAEKVTKETLKELSRDLLSITYLTQDIGFVNRTIEVLTPVNRKVAILFFKEFSGFSFNKDEVKFIAKDKKKWDEVVAKGNEALDDPHFNIWTWADRNIEIEAKPFDITKVTAFAKQSIKKAQEAGMNKGDVFKAFMAGGFEAEELVAILQAVAAGQA